VKRPRQRIDREQGAVALFQTCMVEYQNPAIGKDLVKVYERNGITCSLPEGTACCGAPFLHAGDFDAFRRYAEKNVAALAAEVRAGRDVVVPQPTCGYVLKRDYADHLGGSEDARLVAEHTFDASEYLMRVHKAEGTSLDTTFTGPVPETITYHVPCHLQAQNIGLKSRDLMKLTGAQIKIAAQCTGIDGTWGYRAENVALQQKQIQPLKRTIEQQASECVAGDCHLANGAIAEETGRTPLHPIQLVARAYGIPAED